jgi:hypothetical protein
MSAAALEDTPQDLQEPSETSSSKQEAAQASCCATPAAHSCSDSIAWRSRLLHYLQAIDSKPQPPPLRSGWSAIVKGQQPGAATTADEPPAAKAGPAGSSISEHNMDSSLHDSKGPPMVAAAAKKGALGKSTPDAQGSKAPPRGDKDDEPRPSPPASQSEAGSSKAEDAPGGSDGAGASPKVSRGSCLLDMGSCAVLVAVT